jgi:hypothetical protein
MTNPFKRRWFRVIAWFLMSILTLIALLWLSINWAGARALRAAEAKIRAAGESIDVNEVFPGPVPDDRNFCAIPALEGITMMEGDNALAGEYGAKRERLRELAFWRNDSFPKIGKPPVRDLAGAHDGVRTDFSELNKYFRETGRMPDVPESADPESAMLAALRPQDALVAELAMGLSRPVARWSPALQDLHWSGFVMDMPLPHYIPMKASSGALGLRAAAAARAGEVAKAHEALHILIKMNEATAGDSLLLGVLVSSMMGSSLADAVWEVCDARCGSVEDFERLERALCGLDFRAAALQAYRSEVATCIQAWEQMKDAGRTDWLATSEPTRRSCGGLLPGGIYDGNAGKTAENLLESVILPLRDCGWRKVLESVELMESQAPEGTDWRAKCLHPFQIALGIIGLEGVAMPVRWTVNAQCLIDQAVIACVLERYRIEKGGYPESLDGLTRTTGAALPIDAISGEAMQYRRTQDGMVRLWCVGLDRVDDGGKRIKNAKMNSKEKGVKGDWVWSYSPEK